MEGQLDSPVMRQIECVPLGVIKGQSTGGHEVSGFLEIAGKAKVFCRIMGVPKMEPPAKV